MTINDIAHSRPNTLKMLAVVCALSLPSGARADAAVPAISATDPLIEGAKMCTRHLPRYEREYGVPVHLLSAISSTETGRWHKGLKIAVPWPWTINAEGKGYYFESKQEAIAAVRHLQAQGIRSIDVGCMQVNLVHHAGAFARLEDAFDPETNIAYAAGFLRGLYQESGSWKQAAASYHSKTPSLGEKYIGRVFTSWYKIIEKVRMAKEHAQMQQAAAPQSAPAVVVADSAAVPTAHVAQPVILDESAVAREIAQEPSRPQVLPPKLAVQAKKSSGEQEGRKLAEYKSPHMRVIEVTRKPVARNSAVMIVRPEVDDTQVAAVQALTSRNSGFAVEPYRSPRRDSTLTVAANTQPSSSTASAVVNEAAAPTIAPAIPDFAPATRVVAAPPPGAKVVEVGRTSSRQAGPNFIFQ